MLWSLIFIQFYNTGRTNIAAASLRYLFYLRVAQEANPQKNNTKNLLIRI